MANSQPQVIARWRKGEVEEVRLAAGLDLFALRRLTEILRELRHDPRVRVVILRAEEGSLQWTDGENCAGDMIDQLGRREGWREARTVVDLIEDLGKPVIGLLDGPAVGIGCEIALACNWRIGTARVSFAENIASLGILEGSAWKSILKEVLGSSLALELLLTGRTIDSEEARSRELLQVRTESLKEAETTSYRLAETICLGAPLSIKWAIETVRHGSRLPLADGLRLESALFALSLATSDAREGIRSFLEKRSPQFKGY